MTSDLVHAVLVRYLYQRSWGVAHGDVAADLGLSVAALDGTLRCAGLPSPPQVIAGGETR